MTLRHHCQDRSRKSVETSRRSVGKAAGTGDHVEQDVPLRAQHHQRAQPDVRVERRTTRWRPRRSGTARWPGTPPGTAPSAARALAAQGRSPIQTPIGTQTETRQRDQHDDPRQRQQAESRVRSTDRRPAQRGVRELDDAPQCIGHDRKHDRQPQKIGEPADHRRRRFGAAAGRGGAAPSTDGRPPRPSTSGEPADQRGRGAPDRRPTIAVAAARRSARSGTCRPRPRSAGTEAGRRRG